MLFFKSKISNQGVKEIGFLFFFLILGILTQANGQESTPSQIKPSADLSKLSDEQWVKEMDGIYFLLRYLDDEDELKIIKVQVGLTDEQMEAFKKYRTAYTYTNTAAKNTTADDWRVSVQEREKRAGVRYEKARQEQIQQAHEFRKIIGSKDVDLREWGMESWIFFVEATNALEARKKSGYPDSEIFSRNMLQKIKTSNFYKNYLAFKEKEFKSDIEFNSFVLRHESQLQDRAAFEVCGESVQFGAFENKKLSKDYAGKRKEIFQKLITE
jgi:hypothetical protein